MDDKMMIISYDMMMSERKYIISSKRSILTGNYNILNYYSILSS